MGKNTYVKYLGITSDKNLNLHDQVYNVAPKLNRANAVLSKRRHFVNFNTLKPIVILVVQYQYWFIDLWLLSAGNFVCWESLQVTS